MGMGGTLYNREQMMNQYKVLGGDDLDEDDDDDDDSGGAYTYAHFPFSLSDEEICCMKK
jgi:hypothetical protein